MSDYLIRWAPLAIVLIGIGIMVWAGLVMRRQETEAHALHTKYRIGSMKVEDGDTIVLSYDKTITREQCQAITDQVVGTYADKKLTVLFLEDGVYINRIIKEARPTSDAADFGGMPG